MLVWQGERDAGGLLVIEKDEWRDLRRSSQDVLYES